MEDSYPQVMFKSVPSGKYLSMKGDFLVGTIDQQDCSAL